MTRSSLFLLPLALGVPASAAAQGGIDINPGDTVTVSTGQGFVLAIVISRDEHLFNVRVINGPGVWKRYPAEVRRRGKATAYDHANGIYEVDDRVQVRYEGQWVDSQVIDGMGMEYRVTLPGGMAAWAKPEQMRYVGPPLEKAVAMAGQPPRPGLVSCAGKVEGRYAADGMVPMQMTFRSGKVTISMMGDTATGDCWFAEGKLFLTMPGEEGLMELDLNDDGSLQGPFGELKKKGK
jgi:hypothetical protein